MSFTIMEQPETQAEESSLTYMLDLAQTHSAAQTLDDANIPADDLLNIFTELILRGKKK
jgi:hypothetical protein